MFYLEITIFLYILHISSCDWVSEWMSPVMEQFKEDPLRQNNFQELNFGERTPRIVQMLESNKNPEFTNADSMSNIPSATMKMRLENTLQSAKALAESLRIQINEVSKRESELKDTIFNGRFGVSVVTVTSIERSPRTYLVRDGFWTQCTGVVQLPTQTQNGNLFHDIFSTPKCIGKEISSLQDPCVFNSIIKYETIPTTRRLEYSEDEFLCLKKTFNSTLERYLSVPRQIINETCINGVVRSLEDNVAKCGVRVLSEYTYYPTRGFGLSTPLPTEYCSDIDGSCKLIVAWHVSNASIENFEFLKDERGFKKFFINTGRNIEHII